MRVKYIHCYFGYRVITHQNVAMTSIKRYGGIGKPWLAISLRQKLIASRI